MGVAGPGSARGFVGALAGVTAALASHKPVVRAAGAHPAKPAVGEATGASAIGPPFRLRTDGVGIVATEGVAEKVEPGDRGEESGLVEEGNDGG